MENKREKTTCIFHITGGNNQIMPNATESVQNFYGDRFGGVALKTGHSVGSGTKVHSSEGEEPDDEEPDSLMIAEGELRIYYQDGALLKAIIARIGNCKDASDLANLVVNDMMEHTILNDGIVVKTHFIDALRVFIRFTKGSSTSNIRQHIRRQIVEGHQRGKEMSDSIRGR
ncbi:hypothetical protein [Phocaeicola sp.]